MVLTCPRLVVVSAVGKATAVRDQHMTNQVRRDIAQQLGGLLWGDPPCRSGRSDDDLAAVLDRLRAAVRPAGTGT